jgi:hypothetical protein
MGVKRNIDLSTFMKTYADVMGFSVANHLVNTASKLVRVDTGTLKNSIRYVRTTDGFVVETGALPYAAAQEWGLGKKGKPKYRFTPYMRPAAMEMKNAAILRILSDKSLKAAILRSAI